MFRQNTQPTLCQLNIYNFYILETVQVKAQYNDFAGS